MEWRTWSELPGLSLYECPRHVEPLASENQHKLKATVGRDLRKDQAVGVLDSQLSFSVRSHENKAAGSVHARTGSPSTPHTVQLREQLAMLHLAVRFKHRSKLLPGRQLDIGTHSLGHVDGKIDNVEVPRQRPAMLCLATHPPIPSKPRHRCRIHQHSLVSLIVVSGKRRRPRVRVPNVERTERWGATHKRASGGCGFVEKRKEALREARVALFQGCRVARGPSAGAGAVRNSGPGQERVWKRGRGKIATD